MRRLAKKGYFKITHFPRNRIGYILTPKGAAEKSRLTYAYLQLSFQFYRETRRKIRSLFSRLQDQDARSIAFFGTGDLAEIAYLSLQETELHFAGIGDADENGHTFFSHSVKNIEELLAVDFDFIFITKDNVDNILLQRLESTGILKHKIITL